MKKTFLIIFLSLIFLQTAGYGANNSRTSATTYTSPQVARIFTSMYNERATVYNTLNLTPAQVKEKDKIEKNRYKALKPLYEDLEQEKFVMSRLQSSSATKSAIIKQQTVIRNIYADISKINEKYDKEFVKSLTAEQRHKYHNIKRLQNRQLKENLHNNKRNYLEDKKLRTFGEG